MKNYLLLLISIIGLSLCVLNGCASSSAHPHVPTAADFSIVVSPDMVSTHVGRTTLPVTVSLNAVNGFSGTVNITVSGFPNGINSSQTSFALSPGAAQQITFSAPAAAGTFKVEFQGVAGSLSHSANTTLAVVPPKTPYLVSASYYPWYQGTNFNYTECYEGTLRDELNPPELPALGKYNSQDQDVVTQQIAWSTAAGINVWDLEWMMPNDFVDQTIQNTVLTNPHIGDIRFAMFYDYAVRFNSDLTVTPAKTKTIVSDFQYLAARYFSHPSYLKVGKGRPVVFFYASFALTPVSAVQQTVAAIRKAMTEAGFDIYLIGDEYYAPNAPDPARIKNWDAIFGYNVYAYKAGYSDDNGFFAMHKSMFEKYKAVAQELGVEFVPSVMPGFNDRGVRRTCADNAALARRTSAGAREGSMFAEFLSDLALPYAKDSKLKMLHITSFNEWHEDTEIEPSIVTEPTTSDFSRTGDEYTQGLVYQGYGTTYLDTLRKEIAAAEPH